MTHEKPDLPVSAGPQCGLFIVEARGRSGSVELGTALMHKIGSTWEFHRSPQGQDLESIAIAYSKSGWTLSLTQLTRDPDSGAEERLQLRPINGDQYEEYFPPEEIL